MTERQIGLRKRTRPFTAVPNDAVDDWTIGYRELGLLVRILRMPEGFVIRSEQLSTEGKGKTLRGRTAKREGREAIRTALRNLALAGYYRLVRLRDRQGMFAMATDITEDPDQVWAAQARVFGGKPVPLIEQEDGTYLVKYPDGTMLPDDVVPPEHITAADQDTGDEDPQGPKTGFRAPGNRTSENPASGEPGSGKSGSLKKMVSKDGQQDSVPASQVRPAGAGDGQLAIDGTVDSLTKDPSSEDIAFGISRDWNGWRDKIGKPVAAARPLHQVKDLVLPFVRVGYTEKEIKKALNGIGEGLPSKGQMQRALDTIRDGKQPGANGRPQQRSGGRVNEHWNRSELVAVGATNDEVPDAPKADRIRTERPQW
jgi:hypothetical protein